MTAGLLAQELRNRGVVVLAVSPHPSAPDHFLVYLHGNAGQWANGTAVRRVARVPGVAAVRESQTSTILLVRLARDARDDDG